MAGTFEIYKDKAGAFRFRLKDTNGQVIVTVGGYETKASAIEGIESVQKNAPGAKIEDLGEVSSALGDTTPPPQGPGAVLPKGSSTGSAGAMAAGSGCAGVVGDAPSQICWVGRPE
jgi:hypothetical protein